MYRAIFALLIITSTVVADDKNKDKGKAPSKTLVESPYIKSKVGDWVTTKIVTAGQPNPMTVTTTVLAKTADQVTLKIESKFGDMETHAQEVKVNLKEKYDPLNPPEVNGVKPIVKKLGEGKEKVTVGGKSYDCEWTHFETIIDVMGQKIKSVTKSWTSKDVPCGGMVKSEGEVNGQKTTIELTGHGNKK